MKILHIASLTFMGGGLNKVLLEQVLFERNNLKLESQIYTLKKPCIKIGEEIIVGNSKKFESFILKNKFDIIIFHSLYVKEYLKIYKIIKRNNLNYYIKPHGSFSEITLRKSSFKKKIANVFFFNKFIKEANGIIYLNEEEQSKSYIKKNRVYIQPNGINEISNVSFKLKEQEKVVIYYLGRFDIYYKGLDQLLKMLLKAQDELKKISVEINIYGYGNKSEEKFMQKFIKKIKNNNIRIHGKIYNEEKEAVLKKANIMILVSRTEGMPMGILEACSYGIPSIVTEETNMAKVITKYNSGWICNYENIYSVLREAILTYQKNRVQYIKNSLRLANEFSWNSKKIKEKYMNEYKKIMEEN